jgi:hypothetical protein
VKRLLGSLAALLVFQQACSSEGVRYTEPCVGSLGLLARLACEQPCSCVWPDAGCDFDQDLDESSAQKGKRASRTTITAYERVIIPTVCRTCGVELSCRREYFSHF